MKRISRQLAISAACLGLCAIGLLLSGCASYIPPSGRADLTGITSTSMRESFAAKPAAGFPAGIVAVRVQAPRYRSYYTEHEGGTYGDGRYTVVTAREVEDDADLERLRKLPDVSGIIGISRLLLPNTLQSDRELRDAAARLKADMVLLYTFETTFHDNDRAPVLTKVTLGLSPLNRINIHVTASALVIDTRTGFIYGALETNEKKDVMGNNLISLDAVDHARRDVEKAAFKSLVGEFEKTWPAIVERAKKGA
ncbi:MAG: hypothetical protein EPO07_13925 [Verrucomicrobia bacterium]|nr:MAG: hypothetical protein EPO07_13925 [Verrucomicrobiota bacterium]